jgi:autophagy-related protein 13
MPANRNANLNIELRVRGSQDQDNGVLRFGKHPPLTCLLDTHISYKPRGSDMSPAANAPPLLTESHTFPSVPHPYANITISVRYLTNPHFQLDELESLLSSRFFSLDEGADFTPTLVKNQQRDSLSSSPGSLPLRTSLPASPPSSASPADRMARHAVLPPPMHSRTTSFPSFGSSARPPPIQGSRTVATDAGGMISGPSSVSSRHEISAIIPASSARLRRESMGAVCFPSTCHWCHSSLSTSRIFHLFPAHCRFVARS